MVVDEALQKFQEKALQKEVKRTHYWTQESAKVRQVERSDMCKEGRTGGGGGGGGGTLLEVKRTTCLSLQ